MSPAVASVFDIYCILVLHKSILSHIECSDSGKKNIQAIVRMTKAEMI